MDTHGIYNYRDLPKVKNIYRDRSVVELTVMEISRAYMIETKYTIKTCLFMVIL